MSPSKLNPADPCRIIPAFNRVSRVENDFFQEKSLHILYAKIFLKATDYKKLCALEVSITRNLKNYKPTRFMEKTSHYDTDAADYAVMFIESLCHTKGTWARKPFELIDWQEQIIRDIFGVLKPNGYRQFNTAYIEIPKKQGKSELAAAVALLLTLPWMSSEKQPEPVRTSINAKVLTITLMPVKYMKLRLIGLKFVSQRC